MRWPAALLAAVAALALAAPADAFRLGGRTWPDARARRRQGRHRALRRQAQATAPEFCAAYEPAQPPVGVTPSIDRFGRLVIRWGLGAGAVRSFIAVQLNTCAPSPQSR